MLPGAAMLAAALWVRSGMAIALLLDRNPIASSSRYSKLALQTAIVLLGFTLTIDTVLELSAAFFAAVATYVIGTLLLGLGLARLLRVERPADMLLTGGTAICGGTAIATLAPILGARSQSVAVCMGTVFLLNGVALLTFPFVGHWLELTQVQFGAWVALAIHDTSSVVATAAVYGDQALEVATTVKLGRTLWLIPLVFVVSLTAHVSQSRVRVPGFVLLFIGAALLASWMPLPGQVEHVIALVSKLLLVVALFLVGLEINRTTLRAMRGRAALFAVVLWLLVAPASLLLIYAVT